MTRVDLKVEHERFGLNCNSITVLIMNQQQEQ